MSAYVLDRDCFVKIASFIHANRDGGGNRGLHAYHPETTATQHYISPTDAANALLIGNLESVAYRYREGLEQVPVIRDRDWFGKPAPKAVEMFGILRSLQYQSCERSDYRESLAYAVLIAVLWKAGQAAAIQAGAETWA